MNITDRAVRTARQTLGMTTAQLAKRVGIKQPSISAIEQSEALGTIEISTLRRVAEALGCRLEYSLVPNQPPAETVRQRARNYAMRRIAPMLHTMALEDQAVPTERVEEMIEQIVRTTNPHRFWDED